VEQFFIGASVALCSIIFLASIGRFSVRPSSTEIEWGRVLAPGTIDRRAPRPDRFHLTAAGHVRRPGPGLMSIAQLHRDLDHSKVFHPETEPMIVLLILTIFSRGCGYLLLFRGHRRVPPVSRLLLENARHGQGGYLRTPPLPSRLEHLQYARKSSWYMGVVQTVKVLSIAVFWFLASPTATHALLRSAFESGITPWTKDGKAVIERREEEKKT